MGYQIKLRMPEVYVMKITPFIYLKLKVLLQEIFATYFFKLSITYKHILVNSFLLIFLSYFFGDYKRI